MGILERRLTEDYLDGGDFHFEKCIIKENKRYLGRIERFDIGEYGEVTLYIQLDKSPYEYYKMELDNELFVGSKLYNVFFELGIVNRNGEANTDSLYNQRVRVELERISGELVVSKLESAGEQETEYFDLSDFVEEEV